MSDTKNKPLGDRVKSLIQTIAPKLAQAKSNCKSCNQKRIWLNNFGAKFG